MKPARLSILVAIGLAIAGIWYVQTRREHARWRATCLQNLRSIVAVKEFLAREQGLKPGATVSDRSVADHILGNAAGGGLAGSGVACPAGGEYTVNPIGTTPTCSIPAHSLP